MSEDETREQTTDMTTEQPTEITSEPTVPVDLPVGAVDPERPAAGPAAGPHQPLPHGPSVPTIVWGLLFALIAAAVITVEVSDVDLNVDVTGPAVLLAAGAALVVWGIAGLGRARRR